MECKLPDTEVHIWRADLAATPGNEDWLHEDEKARADRYRFPVLRERFVAARSFLRDVLGRYVDAPPESLQFVYGPLGKPALAGSGPLRFNLSHADDRAVLAVANGREVGIDIELPRDNIEFLDIARRYFSSAEVCWLESRPHAEQRDAFFACWTAKEAYIKARGDGLSFPLDAFQTFAPGDQTPTLLVYGDPAESERWRLRLFRLSPGELVTVAFEVPDASVQVFRYSCD